jgi:hypothetical protein
MAKPKGATLTQLFAVSDQERAVFWAKLGKTADLTALSPGSPAETGVPVSGMPVSGAPASGLPSTGTPILIGPDYSAVSVGIRQEGAPPVGLLGIPDTGAPVSATAEKDNIPAPPVLSRKKIREAVRVPEDHDRLSNP